MSNFVDEVQIHVKAGDGGAGAVSFRREAHTPKGGPDGGDGGKGGDVWLVADNNTPSLYSFKDRPHREATKGTHGAGKAKHGRNGEDVEVHVPVGTVVRDYKTGEIVGELLQVGDRWLAAAGGRGGRGNTRFLTNARRAPTFAEQGEVGEETYYDLEIQLMADVALVGFPNAGKSTLISRLSAAKPKIANYPFTTLEPHLGVVKYHEHEFVLADIPGLIEGASEGKGLGHKFLRHIERSKVLLVLIDLSDTEGRSPEDQERVLLEELGNYREDLLKRPRYIVGSKSDARSENIEWDGPVISSHTSEGIENLLRHLVQLVSEARDAEGEVVTHVIHHPRPEGISIERNDAGDYVVIGKSAERAVALNDLTTAEALEYVQGRLRKLGVDRALARAGASEGDTVHIGKFSFDYEPD